MKLRLFLGLICFTISASVVQAKPEPKKSTEAQKKAGRQVANADQYKAFYMNARRPSVEYP